MGSDHRKDDPRKELYGNLCRQIKAAMNEQGLKQVDLVRLAQQKGINLGKVMSASMSVGRQSRVPTFLHFLADALQVDPDWLNKL